MSKKKRVDINQLFGEGLSAVVETHIAEAPESQPTQVRSLEQNVPKDYSIVNTKKQTTTKQNATKALKGENSTQRTFLIDNDLWDDVKIYLQLNPDLSQKELINTLLKKEVAKHAARIKQIKELMN